MAEQEPTAEQLAQIAAENEEDEHSVNYKPPAQKSIQEIQELDKDDESLRKYKEALLGAVTVSAGEPARRGSPSALRGRRSGRDWAGQNTARSPCFFSCFFKSCLGRSSGLVGVRDGCLRAFFCAF